MSVWTTLLLILILVVAALLLPRVRISGYLSSSVRVIEISTLLYGVRYNARTRMFSGRFVFFFFKRTIKESAKYVKPEPEQRFDARTSSSQKPTIHETQDASKTSSKIKKIKSVKERKRSAKSFDFTTLFWSERAVFIQIIRRIVKMAVNLFKCIHIDRWKSHLIISTGDPMTTGIIFGCIAPLNSLSKPPKVSLTFDLDFELDKPTGELECSFSARPISMILVVLVQLLMMPWLGIYRIFRKSRQSSLQVHASHAAA